MNVKCPFDLKVMISANKYKRQCKFKINFVILLFYTYSYTSYNPKKKKKKKRYLVVFSRDWMAMGFFPKFFEGERELLKKFFLFFFSLYFFAL